MNYKKIAKLAALGPLTALAVSISGCNTIVDQAYDTVNKDMSTMKTTMADNRKLRPSAVSETEDIWLGGDAFKVSGGETAPPILLKQVEFKQPTPIALGDLLTLLSADLKMKIVMTQDAIEFSSGGNKSAQMTAPAPGGAGVEQNVFSEMSAMMPNSNEIKVSLPSYKGTVASLFDLLAAKAGLFWRFEKGEIVFKRNETKTYVVDLSRGQPDYEAEMKSDLSSMGADSSGSSSAGGGGGGSSQDGSMHTTKNTIKGEDGWVNLQNQIKTMLTPTGKVSVNERLGIITVSDTPQVQDVIAGVIKSTNSIASKMLAIKTDVFEISSDENGKFDADILALYDFSGKFSLGMSGRKLELGVSAGDKSKDNRFSTDSSAAVDLLRNNKNASLKTSTVIYARNGAMTPFQQMDEMGYLARITVTQSEGSSGEPIRSFEPGKTSQGFSMMVLPRITSTGKITMDFAIDSTRINSISEFGDDKNGKIQTPNRSANKYNQNVDVKPGEPLMIAGFDRTENQASINSPFGRYTWALGGNQLGGKRKIMTMIVLTPYIMEQ
ncbi:hypothetical protein ACYPKM_02790 [Pseudomonas aeruginosa]